MYRWLTTAVLAACLAGLVKAQDIVTYHDRVTKKDNVQVRGKIEEESPAGIKIKVKEGKKEVVKVIAAGDIQTILYKVPDLAALEYRKPFNRLVYAQKETGKRRTKSLEEALDGFTKLEGQARGHLNARRYFQYKAAEVAALLAQDDPARVESAIKLLADFKASNATSWVIVPALKTLAQLQEQAGKVDDARKTYEELADVPDVPRALKQESAVLVGRLLLRGGKPADAQQRLEKLLATMSAEDAQRPFVQAYLAESKISQDRLTGVDRELAGVIQNSSDTRLRGVAYNLLGDYYRKKGQPQEAFWAYLRVDALYNEDAEAQAKALYHLAKLFDEVKKDPIRGKDCLRRLRDGRFAGTTYQKLLPPAPEEKTEAPVKKGAAKAKKQ
jgi:tetratricopeptide (TPR) repeat protein